MRPWGGNYSDPNPDILPGSNPASIALKNKKSAPQMRRRGLIKEAEYYYDQSIRLRNN